MVSCGVLSCAGTLRAAAQCQLLLHCVSDVFVVFEANEGVVEGLRLCVG